VTAPAHADVEIAPVEHRPARSAVAEAIRARLAAGELRPGDRLPPERVLAERLGVGRMTVRQALRELAAEGLLVTRRGRNGGTVVADAPRVFPRAPEDVTARYVADLHENYEFRMALEPAVARMAAARATREEAAVLRTLAAEPATSLPMYRAVDSRFHVALAEASRNRHALAAVREARSNLFAWADALWGRGDWSVHEATVRRALHDHVLIAEAVGARDGELAEGRMHDHLATAMAAFAGIIDDVGAAAGHGPGGGGT
jgi:DNA-binding FadR family transcriptional regulator